MTESPPDRADPPSEVATVSEQLAALRHQLALRDEFIATAAHELRNPISPVYMQLEHLKETVRSMTEPISKPWLTAQLDGMTMRLDRFLHTLNRMLDASRIGEGHLVLLPEPCDLVEVTRAVVAASQRELQVASCTVTVDAPDRVVGMWDRLRLEQVVSNLLSNAARYGAGAPVAIEITASDERARLSVRDQGIGIAAEDRARIFQRFERARNVGRSAGFGIGLWVVAELCRAMGGRVEVDSELGHGATFTIELPIEPPTQRAAEIPRKK